MTKYCLIDKPLVLFAQDQHSHHNSILLKSTSNLICPFIVHYCLEFLSRTTVSPNETVLISRVLNPESPYPRPCPTPQAGSHVTVLKIFIWISSGTFTKEGCQRKVNVDFSPFRNPVDESYNFPIAVRPRDVSGCLIRAIRATRSALHIPSSSIDLLFPGGRQPSRMAF